VGRKNTTVNKASWPTLILLLVLVVALAGCQTAKATPDDFEADQAWWDGLQTPEDQQAIRESAKEMVDTVRKRRPTYRLGPDDMVRVSVWNRPDLSKEGRVRPDGNYFLPLVGNLKAAGLTAGEFQALLGKHLGRLLRDPQVDVEIVEYASKVYYVFGQVLRPGVFPVKATTTVLEGVASSGGPTEKSNLGGAYLIRGNVVVPIDFYALFERGDIEQNLLLADGDIIYIPNIADAKIYVLGEVNAASAVPMRGRRMRLSEAIALAGGFNETTAFKRGIKIIRGSLTNPQVYTINYEDVRRGKVPDVDFLQNGDIVYVPAGGLTKWDRVLGQLLPNFSRIVLDAAAIDSLSGNR
jgi:polysaccharide biosynthesis/export protein